MMLMTVMGFILLLTNWPALVSLRCFAFQIRLDSSYRQEEAPSQEQHFARKIKILRMILLFGNDLQSLPSPVSSPVLLYLGSTCIDLYWIYLALGVGYLTDFDCMGYPAFICYFIRFIAMRYTLPFFWRLQTLLDVEAKANVVQIRQLACSRTVIT